MFLFQVGHRCIILYIRSWVSVSAKDTCLIMNSCQGIQIILQKFLLYNVNAPETIIKTKTILIEGAKSTGTLIKFEESKVVKSHI